MQDGLLDLQSLQKVVPSGVRSSVTQELVDKFNNSITDPEFRENYRDNLLSFSSVLRDGRFKMDGYLSAVKYVSHKLLGSTNIDAYIKTFPDKYARFMQKGVVSKDVASYVSAYHKSKLVTLIFEQTMMPTHILNADLYQKALNVQADLMMSARSEKVRSDAANSLMSALKPPETKKIELDVGFKEDKTIDDLRAATMELVSQQRDMIQRGLATTQQIAHSKIIEGEVIDEQ